MPIEFAAVELNVDKLDPVELAAVELDAVKLDAVELDAVELHTDMAKKLNAYMRASSTYRIA
jgi:hypothetical protein